jgi:hypothetical protein
LIHSGVRPQEETVRAPKRWSIVLWFRTLRFDASVDDAQRTRVADVLHSHGADVVFGPSMLGRTYALVSGSQGSDPAEVVALVPEARSFDDAVIALAIELSPADALSPVAGALSGGGKPAGVESAEPVDGRLVIEVSPAVTPVPFVLDAIDVELRRFGSGSRKAALISPVSIEVMARVAAGGLQCEEMTPARILEVLLAANAR